MAILSLLLVVAFNQPLTVSLDLRDANLRDFLETMAEAANMNVVLHPAVEGKITLRVREAPWETLLEMVLRNYRLSREIEGNVMRIAPQSVFEEEYWLSARFAAEVSFHPVTRQVENRSPIDFRFLRTRL